MGVRRLILGAILLIMGESSSLPLVLTAEDSLWIKEHPVVRVGIDRHRSPIEFVDSKGEHQGISSDVLAFVSKQTGIHFEKVVNLPWSTVQDEVRARNIDMLASARPIEKRKEFMEFTKPYLQIPTVIAVRNGVRYVESIKDLAGLRVAVVKGNASSEIVLNQGIVAKFITYGSYHEALTGIAKDEADCLVGNLVILTHEIQSSNVPVRIAAPTKAITALSMGVRSDWPELTIILNKALASLGEDQLAGIKARWVNIPVVIGVPWKSVWQMGAVLFLAFAMVLVTFLWTNQKLKREIAERLLAENRAQENEQNYQSLFLNLDQAFSVQEIVKNSSGATVDFKYLEVNTAFCNLVGKESKEIIGNQNSLVGLTSDEELLRVVTQVAETGDPVQLERQFLKTDRWMRYSIFSSRRSTFAMILSDITDQKKSLVDMTSQRDEMSHFIYSISHDLKGPILTISSFSNMLQDDIAAGNAEDVHRDLDYIRKASSRMSLLLEGLLEVARLGRMEMHVVTCKLDELVRESAGLVEGKFRETGIVLRNVERGVWLDADPARMIQVFQNLLENAAKYRNPEVDSWVEVKVEQRAGELIILVRDNGKGIPANKTQSIFNLFDKVDAKSQGSGIGLALVKRIVEMHKGRIWVESPGIGAGCTFCISLPALRLNL